MTVLTVLRSGGALAARPAGALCRAALWALAATAQVFGVFLTAALADPLGRIGDSVAPVWRFARALLAVWLVTIGLWLVGFGNAALVRGFIGGLHRGLPHAIDFTANHAPGLLRLLSGEAVIVVGLALAIGVLFELRARMR